MERVSLKKRVSLFKLCELNKLETHSDSNEVAWRKKWPGQIFLSHKLSTRAGVGIHLSTTFNPQDFEVCHIMDGQTLMVKPLFGGKRLTFLCVFTPVSAAN